MQGLPSGRPSGRRLGSLGPSGPGLARSPAAEWPRRFGRRTSGSAHGRARSFCEAAAWLRGRAPSTTVMGGRLAFRTGTALPLRPSLECTLRGARPCHQRGWDRGRSWPTGPALRSFLRSSAGMRQAQPWGLGVPHPSLATAVDDGLSITFLYSANGPITRIPARIFAIGRPAARAHCRVLASRPSVRPQRRCHAIRFGSRRCFNIRCINAHRVAPGAGGGA